MYTNGLFHCDRATRRKVERYMKKHPKLIFTEAYNKMYNTDYDEPEVFYDLLHSPTARD